MSKRSKLTEYFKTKEEAVAYHDELMANPLVLSLKYYQKILPPFRGWWVVAFTTEEPNALEY